MRTTSTGLLGLLLAGGLAAAVAGPVGQASAGAAPSGPPPPSGSATAPPSDELPNPLADKQRALRQEALTDILSGSPGTQVTRRGPSTVARVGTALAAPAVDAAGRQQAPRRQASQYVELSRQKTDRIFVVLVEFGDTRHPDYPDKDTDPATPGPTVFDGPRHDAIPKPNRKVDNATVWQPHYGRKHYQDLYFGTGGAPGSGGRPESVRQYYERQSSGRYSVSGAVTDWVRVRYNEARYGRSGDTAGTDPAVCAGIVCSTTWNLVDDAVDQWVLDREAAGRTRAQIRAELATFDRWDRYDHDNDGNFNEPDGYIDHFQIVHAGGDEADGDPQQGEDAIWSHRWYTQTTPMGGGGPAGNPMGGSQIGGTGYWVGDYTVQPENGGASVFAHEYGHDLGLPDLYDTAGGDNGVEWWSLMAQSRLSARGDRAIGTRVGDLGAWEKLQLGWLDYAVVRPVQGRSLWLGPHEYNSTRPQAVVVVLPKKTVTTPLVPPRTGSSSWWSGSGDDLDATMTRRVTLAAGTSTLRMQARWDIEDCGEAPCDDAYVEVDDGSGWRAVPGSITRPGGHNGIVGTSKGWVPATFDLSAYAGKTVGLRLRYVTDGALGGLGFFADDVSVVSGGSTLFTSGAESGTEGWTLAGFTAAGSGLTRSYDDYYLASHRDHVSFDSYLRTGPYNFGWAKTRPRWVEHFPYQDGLLLSYWDTSQRDNNTSEHPGAGLVLPVDAHPRPRVRLDGQYWRSRVAGYDAPFSTERSDSFTLHVDGRANLVRGKQAQPLFDDSRAYWYPQTPDTGVKVPVNGVDIRVQRHRGTDLRVKVHQRR